MPVAAQYQSSLEQYSGTDIDLLGRDCQMHTASAAFEDELVHDYTESQFFGPLLLTEEIKQLFSLGELPPP